MKKLFVISLGGSLINPGEVDVKFLKDFRKLIIEQAKKGSRFILITGGGAICRQYQNGLRAITKPTNEDLDWLGIYSTQFNAQLLRLIFKDTAYPSLSSEVYTKKINFKQPILVTGGYKPGRSSDGAMIAVAKTYGSKTVINLSNIDYVYTKDPRKFKDARKMENISWKDFRKIVGNKWDPGKNLPFDPTAAKLAESLRLRVIISNGKNLTNLKNILSGKPFKGTLIS